MDGGAAGDLGIPGIVDAVRIGEGGAATVYRARQEHLDRIVAVKVIHSAPNEATLRRFGREASALGMLSDHAGIVSVYDAGMTAANQPYLVMQLCEQGTLEDMLGGDGVLDGAEACRMLAPVADTLADAHDEAVVHRDVKPANLLIGKDGELLVADFGIAALQDATTGVSTSISFSPGYVPPETLQGAMPDTPGDVYSLGATLYAMTTGSAPYANGTEPLNLMETVARMASGQRVPPTEFGVAASTAELIEAAMDRNPSARPTMREFARLLRSEAGEAASPPAVKPTSAAPETRTATRIVANPVAEPPIDLSGPRSGTGPGGEVPVPASGTRRGLVVGALVSLAVIAAVAIGVLALGGSDDPTDNEVAASTSGLEAETELPATESRDVREPTQEAAPTEEALAQEAALAQEPGPTERPEPAATPRPAATAVPTATAVPIYGSADCRGGSDPLFAGRSTGPGQSDTGALQSEIRIAICTDNTGAVEYYGLTLDDGLSIRLAACQSTAGVWQASNNDWNYTVIDQSSSADERGILRLLSPGGTLVTWSIGLDVIRNPILSDQAARC